MRSKLIYERKRCGMQPEQVASMIGVTKRMYYFYESGRRTPSLRVANALEDLFGIPQRDLLVYEHYVAV